MNNKLKGVHILKNLLQGMMLALTLLVLAACGGGGTSGSATAPTSPVAKSTAVLTINLTGALPVGTTISGAIFTVTLPANVTPALTTSGDVATGVIYPSGTFAGSTPSPQATYTAATGELKVVLASSVSTGVSQVGEVAKITLQLANGVEPAVASFGIKNTSVIDATVYGVISGMGVSVAGVTLQ